MAAYMTYELERASEDNYDVLKYLGKGTYGEVVMAIDKKMNRLVALKMVKKEIKLEPFLHELCVSISLNGHEGIITTYSCFLETDGHYIFSQELAPAGSLHSLIKPEIGMPEKLVKHCAYQISKALEYMHSKGLVHRDVKPDNILLMDERCHRVKLSDFGLTQPTGSTVPFMSPIIAYMAPELCELKRDECIVIEPSVDLWALGVLLYCALTGCFPWKQALVEDPLFQRFVDWQRNLDFVPPPKGWKKISREARDMFHILFSQEPTSRNQVEVVLHYLDFPWIIDHVDQEVFHLEDQEVCHLEDQEVCHLEEQDFYMIIAESEDEDVFLSDDEREIIVIEGENDFYVIENRGDLECVILNDATPEFILSSANSEVLLLSDSEALYLGSEVEV